MDENFGEIKISGNFTKVAEQVSGLRGIRAEDAFWDEFLDTDMPVERKDRLKSNLEKLTDLTIDYDKSGKALTGRTPERIEQEGGINAKEMFPDEGNILYIGDPWQRMGKEIDETRLFIIDYEFGEVAEFVKDKELFLSTYELRLDRLRSTLDWLVLDNQNTANITKEDEEWLSVLRDFVTIADNWSQSLVNDQDYNRAALVWSVVRKYVETSTLSNNDNGENYLSAVKTNVWYDCVFAQRGFTDIPDYQNIIKPQLEAKKIELSNLNTDQREVALKNWERGFIEEIRLKRQPKKAHVTEAAFPLLPFAKDSFDRIVASWSISAHAFSILDSEGFNLYWDEIKRVLRTDGKAYIFPLDYEPINISLMIETLQNSGLKFQLIDNEGIVVDDKYAYGAYTLLIEK